MRVLVIDDEAALRQTMRRMLESAGHEVIEAENGRLGLEAYRKQPADVVLTDIIMPQKEGIETIRDIRAVDSKVRIVAISGGGRHQNMDFLRIAAKLGASSTLAKPFRKEELLACVEGRASPAKD
jgi:YesN/AraC family two-component response regulator